ncbi:Thiol-disulfide interchange protein, contains DsbC and DsbD domains [Pseudorhodobacter antarcticus]|jgi:DsbC/DsbD-like thiol-disulfide interchange protein|uniref:Thiol-disulfide interchange protein, contains DsbC and DsbD domains n=2 Tax=Pseudorhodobacter antarcticus TaxID=1077947 RepID=A0A1H8F291_9RHOB|nr:Thiol-disulfide interchange protein, contains DsbC and DsbD domains [Pseudorhodobacter antarcticus]
MIAFSLVACLMGGPVHAQPDVLRADLRAGWQTEGGGQMVAFHLTLQDGWKTYWRAPGDAGIPPHFDWSGSQNVKSVRFHWPRPEVFHVGGMQSIGYSHELVLPVEVVPIDPTKPVNLRAAVDVGVCSDICVPASFQVGANLPRPGVADATIRRALGQRPSTAKEAGVTGVTCEVTPQKDGLRVTAVLTMPSTGGPEVVVLEPGLPGVWVSPADVTRNGGQLRAVVDMVGPTGGAFGLQRDAIVVTVLGKHRAVEVKGCAAP